MEIPQQHYIENDVLLVHKPKGITSFDVVRQLRSILDTKKIGHAGTLDPLAHGLMIVGVGPGTKKLNHYLKLPKTYIANIALGSSTTTGDAEGEVVEEKIVYPSDLKDAVIEDAVNDMIGEHTLQAPLYSALKVQGKPLYWYARNNIEPPYIPEKEMNIRTAQFLDAYSSGKYHIVSIRFDVSSGTYIRTLAEELGKRLGYPAHLTGLYRVTIGDFQDQDAFKGISS